VLTDLHVDSEDPRAVAELGSLLELCADAPVLLLLGDLFEYWLGPSQASGPGGRQLLDLLAAFPGRVHLIPGNRDVLAGSELEAALGSPLLWHGCLARLDSGERLLFLHGDELCLADRSYQRLRRVLRARLPRTLLRGLPAPLGHVLARRLRQRSRGAVAAKAPLEVAQDPAEAARRLCASDADLLVVGHTHAFRDVPLGAPREGARLVVLDAVGGARDLLRIGRSLADLEFCASADLATARPG
jgi:UDP-2,3-diacylglucosamine hydrolase